MRWTLSEGGGGECQRPKMSVCTSNRPPNLGPVDKFHFSSEEKGCRIRRPQGPGTATAPWGIPLPRRDTSGVLPGICAVGLRGPVPRGCTPSPTPSHHRSHGLNVRFVALFTGAMGGCACAHCTAGSLTGSLFSCPQRASAEPQCSASDHTHMSDPPHTALRLIPPFGSGLNVH